MLYIWHNYCWVLWGIQNRGFGPCDFWQMLILSAPRFSHLDNGDNCIDCISGLLWAFLKITYRRGHYALYTKGVSLTATSVVVIVTRCTAKVPFPHQSKQGWGLRTLWNRRTPHSSRALRIWSDFTRTLREASCFDFAHTRTGGRLCRALPGRKMRVPA